jgi:hypothetical protein
MLTQGAPLSCGVKDGNKLIGKVEKLERVGILPSSAIRE